MSVFSANAYVEEFEQIAYEWGEVAIKMVTKVGFPILGVSIMAALEPMIEEPDDVLHTVNSLFGKHSNLREIVNQLDYTDDKEIQKFMRKYVPKQYHETARMFIVQHKILHDDPFNPKNKKHIRTKAKRKTFVYDSLRLFNELVLVSAGYCKQCDLTKQIEEDISDLKLDEIESPKEVSSSISKFMSEHKDLPKDDKFFGEMIKAVKRDINPKM